MGFGWGRVHWRGETASVWALSHTSTTSTLQMRQSTRAMDMEHHTFLNCLARFVFDRVIITDAYRDCVVSHGTSGSSVVLTMASQNIIAYSVAVPLAEKQTQELLGLDEYMIQRTALVAPSTSRTNSLSAAAVEYD